jgi:hypothetical protein
MTWACDLPACSIALQPTTLPRVVEPGIQNLTTPFREVELCRYLNGGAFYEHLTGLRYWHIDIVYWYRKFCVKIETAALEKERASWAVYWVQHQILVWTHVKLATLVRSCLSRWDDMRPPEWLCNCCLDPLGWKFQRWVPWSHATQ